MPIVDFSGRHFAVKMYDPIGNGREALNGYAIVTSFDGKGHFCVEVPGLKVRILKQKGEWVVRQEKTPEV